jgi:hypothetical protein
VGESGGRDDPDGAALGLVLPENAPDAAEVVDVAVGQDDRGDRPVAQMAAGLGERCARRLGRSQGVDQDPAGLPLDQRHVGEVVAAHLMDTVRHLEEAVNPIELRLAPQARVDARGRIARHERVVPGAPRGASVLPRDDDVRISGDEPSPRILEILRITEGELPQDRRIRLDGPRGGGRVASGVGVGGPGGGPSRLAGYAGQEP